MPSWLAKKQRSILMKLILIHQHQKERKQKMSMKIRQQGLPVAYNPGSICIFAFTKMPAFCSGFSHSWFMSIPGVKLLFQMLPPFVQPWGCIINSKNEKDLFCCWLLPCPL